MLLLCQSVSCNIFGSLTGRDNEAVPLRHPCCCPLTLVCAGPLRQNETAPPSGSGSPPPGGLHLPGSDCHSTPGGSGQQLHHHQDKGKTSGPRPQSGLSGTGGQLDHLPWPPARGPSVPGTPTGSHPSARGTERGRQRSEVPECVCERAAVCGSRVPQGPSQRALTCGSTVTSYGTTTVPVLEWDLRPGPGFMRVHLQPRGT